MLKKIRITLRTERFQTGGNSLFEEAEEYTAELSELFWTGDEDHPTAGLTEDAKVEEDVEPEVLEMTIGGVLRDDGERVEVRYSESKLSGMEGSKTVLAFNRSEPLLLSMTRGGTVSTALTFEPGKRYLCSYQTPFMPFEVCVYTLSVVNTYETDGCISLDYVIEIRGAQAEHCRLFIRLREDPAFPGTGLLLAEDREGK